jgi:hypothetical protein
MKDTIFPLSEAGNARIEFKTYRFLLYSHKEGTKPISLTKSEMTLLCEKLPVLQKEMEKLMQSVDGGGDNSSDKHDVSSDEEENVSFKAQKRRRINSDDSDDQIKQPSKQLENKTWKTCLISSYKNFETKFFLNTYDQKPWIWLRLYFDANNDPKAPADSNKKKKRKDMKPCRGGLIFNDVNSANLTKFVKNFC